MGLISSIKKAASKVKEVAKTVGTALIKDQQRLSPIKVDSGGLRLPTTQEFKQQTKQTATSVILGGAAVAAAANPVAAASLASKVVKSIIPKSTLGKVAASALVLPAAASIISNPQTVKKGASGVFNVEKNLIKVGRNPTGENIKELITENPIIVGAAAGAAALIGLKGASGAIASLVNTKAIKENTQVTQAAQTTQGKVLPAEVAAPVPVTPATQTIEATKLSDPTKSTKRRKSKRREAVINNRVNVLISNRNNNTGIRATKRIIKRDVLTI